MLLQLWWAGSNNRRPLSNLAMGGRGEVEEATGWSEVRRRAATQGRQHA